MMACPSQAGGPGAGRGFALAAAATNRGASLPGKSEAHVSVGMLRGGSTTRGLASALIMRPLDQRSVGLDEESSSRHGDDNPGASME